MPIFVLKCTNKQCGDILEIIESYDNLKSIICSCGSPFMIVPSRSRFIVNGFSAENGYHRPEFSSITGQDASWD